MVFFPFNSSNFIHAKCNQFIFKQVTETYYRTATEKSNTVILHKNKSHVCLYVSEVFLNRLMTTRSEKSVFIIKLMQRWALPPHGDVFSNSFLLLQECFALDLSAPLYQHPRLTSQPKTCYCMKTTTKPKLYCLCTHRNALCNPRCKLKMAEVVTEHVLCRKYVLSPERFICLPRLYTYCSPVL